MKKLSEIFRQLVEGNNDRRSATISMESVTIESRPRLQSCNVFVRLLDASNSNNIQVKLNKDYVTLRIGKKSYNLCLSSIRIIPTSLSSLRVTGSWLSFRIQTTPVSLFGSFQTELLGTASIKNGNLSNSSSSIELPLKDTNIIISCNCCQNFITETINLKKVLPLPDADCDPSEWFCCTHSTDDYSKLLEPKKTDYFYGPFYTILNREIFVKKLIINADTVVCNRCLAVLGKPQSDDSLKIWNCCMEYGSVDESSKIRVETLADFEAAVKSCTEAISSNERILLEASESGKTRYILFKPMEQNLHILVAPKNLCDLNAIRLEDKTVIKVSYDYGESRTTLKNDYLDAKHCQIAMKSMLAGIEQLVSSSKRIPPIYRSLDDLHIGYINSTRK